MRRIRALPYVLAAVLLTSCGSDSATNPSETTLSGVFVLQSVNNKPLPYSYTTIEAGNAVVFSLTSDRITLQEDGNFAESMAVTVTQGNQTTGPAIIPSSGTYVYSSSTNAITLRASDGGQISGTVSSNTMALKEDGDTFVYSRQP
jgi:hypothetical protein